jgi:hypothetical protein
MVGNAFRASIDLSLIAAQSSADRATGARELHHIQHLAILSAAMALLATPAGAAPKLAPTAAPGFIIPVQGYANGSVPGLGGFLGGGSGFGGGGYNNWPTQPRPQPPPPPPPQYSTYQPPPPPRPQAPAPAPVASAPSYSETTSIRRTTVARPIPNAQPNFLATLSGVNGDDVSMRSAGGAFTNIASGRQLKAADELATGPDTEVTLTLRDGSTVHVGPATHIGLAALDERSITKSLMTLQIGEISPRVSPGASTGYNFAVKTDRATTDVREADFTVRHDKQAGVTTVSVEDGVVQVTPADSSLKPVSLQTGQQAEIAVDHVNTTRVLEDSAASAAADLTGAPGSGAVIPASSSAPAVATATSAAPAADATPTSSVGAPAPATDSTRATDSTAVATAAGPAPGTPPAVTDLTGSWITQDGSTVQLTQSGNQVSWDYHGPTGHEALVGTISGTFDGKFLVGTFHYKEGDAVGNGTITLTIDGNRLVGGWVSTSPPGMSGAASLIRQ